MLSMQHQQLSNTATTNPTNREAITAPYQETRSPSSPNQQIERNQLNYVW